MSQKHAGVSLGQICSDMSRCCHTEIKAADRGPEKLFGNVLGLLSCLMQCRGFDPPLRRFFFPVEGIFPLELTWVLTPVPLKLFRMRV